MGALRTCRGVPPPVRAWVRWGVVLLCAVGVLQAADSSRAAKASDPNTLKATWLTKFPLFVLWPTNVFKEPDSPLVLGILGQDPFGKDFDEALKSPQTAVEGRRLEVRRYKNVSEVGECHLLFISSSEEKNLQAIVEGLRQRPVMMVSDVRGFASRGGTLEFVMRSDSLRFEINVSAAKRCGLEIQSKLLVMATRLIEAEGAGEGKASLPARKEGS